MHRLTIKGDSVIINTYGLKGGNEMVTFNGHSEDEFELSVKDVKRSVLPNINNRLRSVAGRDGQYNFGSQFTNGRVIQVTFHAKHATSKEDLHSIMANVAAWLYPLDKQVKALKLDDEPNFTYYTVIGGDTNIEEILYYGYFTVNFLVLDGYRYGDNESWIPEIVFLRNSVAENAETIIPLTSYLANEPRFYTIAGSLKGLEVEEGTVNIMANPLFGSPTLGVPNLYTGFATNATGSHGVTGIEYTASMATSSAIDGRVGILPTAKIAVSVGEIYNVFVVARLVAATLGAKARARVRAYAADGTTVVRDVWESKTASAVNVKLSSGSMIVQADEFFYNVILDAYADGTSGATATAAFNIPQWEEKNYNTSFIAGTRVFEKVYAQYIGNLGETWGLGITLIPAWGKTDLMGDSNFRRVLSLADAFDGNLNKLITLVWNPTSEKFKVGRWKTAVEVASNLPSAPAFNAGDILKFYISHENQQTKLEMTVNGGTPIDSGYVFDVRDGLDDFLYLIIGDAGNGANVINGIVSNLQLRTDETPDSVSYFNS